MRVPQDEGYTMQVRCLSLHNEVRTISALFLYDACREFDVDWRWQ